MEIPTSVAGVVKELKVKVGDTINQGDLIVLIESDAAAAPAPAAAAPAPAAAAPAPSAPAPAPAAPAAAPAAPASAGPVDIEVPDIGDFDEVAVIEVLVKVGDTVKQEQSLITVESDKASMEIPSSHGGVIKELLVKVGDKVSKGKKIAVIEAAGGAGAPAPAAAAPAQAAAAPAPATASAPAPAPAADRQVPTAALPPHEPTKPTGRLPHASPTIRKLARELGVPLEEVKGSGAKGRITESDVQGFVKAVMAGTAQTAAQKAAAPAGGAGGGAFPGLLPWPKVDFEQVRPGRSARRCRASRRSPAPTCTATG